MKFFLHGILGMNARNLKYIKEHNSPDSISLADSKLKTKHFLGSRGIPFAETYGIISSYEELQKFQLRSVRAENFVIKPNRGSGGRGILIVKRKGKDFLINAEIWTEKELRLHMLDILHGSYSLQSGADSIVIEEQILPGGDFSHFCRYGLADIRIIVYNLVPISAMVRMPTKDSGGKANLAQGGIGIGLNIANGAVINLYKDRESYTRKFPDEYKNLQNIVLPFWESILLYSSQIQLFTKLGYLALDWVITKNGPKLLEINARAGLEIQNVNRTPLAARLHKIEDLQIQSPEKGVEIAKSLFHADPISPTPEKETIHFIQSAKISDETVRIVCEPGSDTTRVSKNLLARYGEKMHLVTSSGVEIHLQNAGEYEGEGEDEVHLGKDVLMYYLIDTSEEKIIKTYSTHTKWQDEVVALDQAVYLLGKKVNLSSLLKPDNYFDELDKFSRLNGEYNPQFEYHFPTETTRDEIQKTIDIEREKSYKLKQSGSLIGSLYIEKIEEIEHKLGFIGACKDERLDKKHAYNEALFGKTNEETLKLAKEKTLSAGLNLKEKEEVLGRVLDTTQIFSMIQSYFENHNIQKVPIVMESGNLSRISVSYGKDVKIHIAKNAVIRQRELEAILSHEIGTHLRRYFRGKELGLKIFEHGTGYYLSDEEGLAVLSSLAKLPDGYEKNSMYYKYFLVHATDTLDFSDTVKLLRSLYPDKTTESLFSDALRLKRGTKDTSIKGSIGTNYHKDKIYLDGYIRVRDWKEASGDIEKLFIGKIKIDDLKILEHLLPSLGK